MRDGGARRCRRRCARRFATAARTHPPSWPSGRCRAAGALRVARRCHGRAARRAARPRRLLRAWRTLSAPLVAADDGDPGRRGRRVRGHRRRLPAARRRWSWPRRSRPASRGCSASAARTPSPRSPTAPPRCRAWTRSSGPATATSRPPRRSSPPTAASTSTPARPRSSSSPPRGRAAWIAADLIAQAEHDPDARAVLITPSRTLAEPCAARSARRACRPTVRRARRCARTAASSSRASVDEAIDAGQRRPPPEHLVVDDDRMAAQVRCAGSLFVGRVVGAGRRRLRHRVESRAADCAEPRACAAACRRRISSGRSPCSG